MGYLDVALSVFVKFAIMYSVLVLFGFVAVEIATCPDKDRFVTSERSGAIYVCDRNGVIAQLNAALEKTQLPSD